NRTVAKMLGLQYAWSILKTDTIGDNPYRAINGIFDARNSSWIYGDKLDINIGKLDDSVVTQYGEQVEWILFTPFLNLEKTSINKIEIATIPGFNTIDDASVALSLTYNGLTYGGEYWLNYGSPLAYDNRFIFRRLGYVSDFVGLKFRGISTSKMAFGLMKVDFS
ncbi:MAG TPA: packaged DNA stabilization protein, partial [Methanosarcinales archaeon]|nr:packaged DNA stabilization protein [Methanosarcinales archaeon]